MNNNIVYGVFSPTAIVYENGVPYVNLSSLITSIQNNTDIRVSRPNVTHLRLRKDSQELLEFLGDKYSVNPDALIIHANPRKHIFTVYCEVTMAIHFLSLSYPEVYPHMICSYVSHMSRAIQDKEYSLWSEFNKLNKMGKPYNERLSLEVISYIRDKVVPDREYMHVYTVDEVTRIDTGIEIVRNLLNLALVSKTTDWKELVKKLTI